MEGNSDNFGGEISTSIDTDNDLIENESFAFDINDKIENESLIGKQKKKGILKKAPNAPKRFKSAYICFVMEKMEEIKNTLPPDMKITDSMKHLANLWKALPTVEKEHYQSLSDIDKSRYFNELSHYHGPLQIPKQKVKKPLDTPKRAISAFLSFSQEHRNSIRCQHPDLKNAELSRLLAEKWKSASEEQKRPHLEKEVKEREKYHIEMAQWKKSRSSNSATVQNETTHYPHINGLSNGNDALNSSKRPSSSSRGLDENNIDYFQNLSSFVSSSFYNNSSLHKDKKKPISSNSSNFVSFASDPDLTYNSSAFQDRQNTNAGGGVSDFFRSFVRDNERRSDGPNGTVERNYETSKRDNSIFTQRKKEEINPKTKKVKNGNGNDSNSNPISLKNMSSNDLYNYSTISPLDIALAGSNIKTASFLSDVNYHSAENKNPTAEVDRDRNNTPDLQWLQQVRLAQHQLDEKKSTNFSNYSNYRRAVPHGSALNLNDKSNKVDNMVSFRSSSSDSKYQNSLNNSGGSLGFDNKKDIMRESSEFFFPDKYSIDHHHQQQQEEGNINANFFAGKKNLLNYYAAPPLSVAQTAQAQAPNYTQSDFADFISNTFYNPRADDLDFYQNSFIEKLDEMNDDDFNDSKDLLNSQAYSFGILPDSFNHNFEGKNNSSLYESFLQMDGLDNKEIKTKNNMKNIINNTSSYYDISERYS